MHVAIYARVSTERQERHQTIDSQLTALRAWAAGEARDLDEAHVFRDEGYSGARLDRPGLDALRDAVRDGAVEHIAVLTPDRLARRYAYQVLLLEEFRKAGCQVTFLQHPISDDPNDQLLLQIQGAIAEYERAVMGERFRRGKLQKAREGHYQCGRAPYGYRYVPRHDTAPGHLVIDEAEAELVRMIYSWLTDEQMTIRQILKRLNAGPHFPRSGRHPWSPSVVHHILADPVYAGTAYANRYTFMPPKKPRRDRGPRSHEASCRQPKPREQWIAISVPALVEANTWDRAQTQLARNAALSFRNNTKYNYLLRCLLTCRTCGLAMYGRTCKATTRQPERRYYQCHGKDCVLTARPARCPSRNVKAVEIEAAVWDHVAGLLADPARLVAQFARFAAVEAGSDRERAADQLLRTRMDRTDRADKRLLDAYEAGAVSLAEMSERRHRLAEERRGLGRQQQDRDRLRQQRAQAEAVRTSLEAFCARVGTRLEEASLADKQAILQLIIERIIVGDGSLEIRHVIPLSPGQPSSSGASTPESRLRPDGVDDAGLDLGLREHGGDRLGKALQAVDDGDEDVEDAAVAQLVHDAQPELGALGLLDPEAKDVLGAVGADAERDVHGLVADRTLVAHLHPQGIEEDQRVEGFERPVLPLGNLVQHGVGHRADQAGRDFDAVEFAQMPLDLAGTHAPGVHRHDLVVEAGEAALVLGDELRIEGRQPVARDLQIEPAGAGQHRLRAVAVPAIGPAIRLAALEMVVEFGVQRPLRQRLLEPVQQAPIGQGGSGIRSGQKLVQQLIRDRRLFASRHTMAPSAASYGPKHRNSDSPEVVDAQQLTAWEGYRDAPRLGRKTRLSERQRQSLWTIFAQVQADLAARKLVSWAHIFDQLAELLRTGKSLGFDFAVVDEAQDLSMPEARLLAALAGDKADGLFFAGDLGQRIFQQPFSWKSLGIDVRGRSHTLRINYRTSHQIRTHPPRAAYQNWVEPAF